MSNNEQIESQETEQKQDILTEAELNEVSAGLKRALVNEHGNHRHHHRSNDKQIAELAIDPVPGLRRSLV